MVQYAKYDDKFSALATDFGYEFACKVFGQTTVDQMPKFQRGPNKGKLKGFIGWRNCVVGGWSRAHGGVITPGKCVRAWLTEQYYGQENSAVSLEWCGRREKINFDRLYLFDVGRTYKADENERYRLSNIENIHDAISACNEKIRTINTVIAVVLYSDNKSYDVIELFAVDRAKHERSIASLENQLVSYGVQF